MVLPLLSAIAVMARHCKTGEKTPYFGGVFRLLKKPLRIAFLLR